MIAKPKKEADPIAGGERNRITEGEADPIAEGEEKLPPDFAIPPSTTGTVDDDDDPADEREDENEAPVRHLK
jgi:hypothetical protein